LFGRRHVNARLDAERAMDRGAFLAKLWAHFGAPSARHGGFEYYVRDTETGLDFIAYCGRHGPSYGGDPDQRLALLRVMEAFEEVLEGTAPADCAVEYVAEPEYGSGTWVVGWQEGRSFDMPDRRERRATPDRRAAR
jgi:hypothetical protein